MLNLGFPNEWFYRWEKSERSYVLVLWLDEDKLLNPYKNLHSIFEELGGNLNVNVKLVGPAGSGTLLKLIKDTRGKIGIKQNRNLQGVGTLDIFSPTATISNCDLYTMKAIGASHVMESQWKCFISSEIDMAGLSGLPIVRTIATDDVLSVALLWELWRRGINRSPSWQPEGEKQSSGENSKSPSVTCDDGLLLLREWDTQYASH